MPNTLIIGSGSPQDMRRPYIDAHELFSTSSYAGEAGCVFRPPGHFDITDYLRFLPAPWNKPELLVTLYMRGDYLPRNLHKVDCPKVMIISDTHHGLDALTAPLKAVTDEAYDLVVLQYTPQHVRWFQEAGCENAVCIPCFGINPIRLEPKEPTRGPVFVGNVSPLHVRRRKFLEQLKADGIDVEVIQGVSREEAAKLHNEAVCSINIPLNGDTNLRGLEIIAAGGVEATTQAEINRFVANPKARMRWAQQHHDVFWKSGPKYHIDRLFAALSRTPTNRPKFPPSHTFWQRVTAYEHMQELRRLDISFTDMEDLR